MAQFQKRTRFGLFVLALVGALSLSACYKNAGENLEPTSNRVELDDLSPTLTPTADDSGVSPTPSTQPLQATPTAGGLGVPPNASAPTPDDTLPDILPTRAEPTATPSGPTITTPSMSDIIPTAIPTATIDPTLLPSPTALPPGADPCAVVIAGGDTLMSIARDNDITVEGLVAANPSVLTAGAFTTLQIGWELRLPDCGTPVAPAAAPEDSAAQPVDPVGASGPTVHIVQAGDTLFSIAQRYGVTVDAITAANSIANPNALSVGQQLTIPAP